METILHPVITREYLEFEARHLDELIEELEEELRDAKSRKCQEDISWCKSAISHFLHESVEVAETLRK